MYVPYEDLNQCEYSLFDQSFTLIGIVRLFANEHSDFNNCSSSLRSNQLSKHCFKVKFDIQL